MYSETQRSGRSFYSELVEINSNEKENSGMYRGFDEEVLETKPVETTHRLYINMDGVVKYKLIGLIINEFGDEKIPFHFKYNDASRDDTIVMWTDNENLVKTIELLKK